MAGSGPKVFLDPITPDKIQILVNLFELYCHDFSEYVPIDLKPSGRFEIDIGDEWWNEADHFPYFIRAGEKLCGFVLARKGSVVSGASEVLDVAEFFVVRGARRAGVGASAARLLFAALPGEWEVRVRESNVAALEFWTSVVQSAAGTPVRPETFHSQGVDWNVFRVTTRSSSSTGTAALP